MILYVVLPENCHDLFSKNMFGNLYYMIHQAGYTKRALL